MCRTHFFGSSVDGKLNVTEVNRSIDAGQADTNLSQRCSSRYLPNTLTHSYPALCTTHTLTHTLNTHSHTLNTHSHTTHTHYTHTHTHAHTHTHNHTHTHTHTEQYHQLVCSLVFKRKLLHLSTTAYQKHTTERKFIVILPQHTERRITLLQGKSVGSIYIYI